MGHSAGVEDEATGRLALALDQFGRIVAVDAAGHDQAVCLHDVEGLMLGVVDDDAHAVLLLCDVGLKEVQQIIGVDAVQRLLAAAVEEVASILHKFLPFSNAERTRTPDEGEEVCKYGSVDDAINV